MSIIPFHRIAARLRLCLSRKDPVGRLAVTGHVRLLPNP